MGQIEISVRFLLLAFRLPMLVTFLPLPLKVQPPYAGPICRNSIFVIGTFFVTLLSQVFKVKLVFYHVLPTLCYVINFEVLRDV